MAFFVGSWVVLLLGWAVHLAADRHPDRRSRRRVIELALLWLLVGGGVTNIVGGFAHIGPNSAAIADQIGYRPSMFQWEVGWGDIAIGTLGVGCALPRLRGTWMTAAVVAWTISFGGDAVGHLMQLVAHDNREPSNVWSLPSDVLMPLLAIALLVAYRRMGTGAAGRTSASLPGRRAPAAGHRR
jgi:hypothetical protein